MRRNILLIFFISMPLFCDEKNDYRGELQGIFKYIMYKI
jgi:hypothetical protein